MKTSTSLQVLVFDFHDEEYEFINDPFPGQWIDRGGPRHYINQNLLLEICQRKCIPVVLAKKRERSKSKYHGSYHETSRPICYDIYKHRMNTDGKSVQMQLKAVKICEHWFLYIQACDINVWKL
jgi:hypothetical protein